jgi:hypothetical protein
MRRFVTVVFVAGALAVLHAQPVLAGASTDAALGLGAFAVLNQIVRGETIFSGAVVQPRPVIVQQEPVVVAPPPPPTYVVPAPPTTYVIPAPPPAYVVPSAPVYVAPQPRAVVVQPRGEWIWRGGRWIFVADRGHGWGHRYRYHHDD